MLVESGEVTVLRDATVLVGHDDRCVEVQPSHECLAVDTGEAVVFGGHWLLYRDRDHRFRVRNIEPNGGAKH